MHVNGWSVITQLMLVRTGAATAEDDAAVAGGEARTEAGQGNQFHATKRRIIRTLYLELSDIVRRRASGPFPARDAGIPLQEEFQGTREGTCSPACGRTPRVKPF